MKRCYTLSQNINYNLLESLEAYGLLEVQQFSKYHSEAKDTFRIHLEGCMQITGVIDGEQLFITLVKSEIQLIQEVESVLTRWHEKMLMMKGNS